MQRGEIHMGLIIDTNHSAVQLATCPPIVQVRGMVYFAV